jgi:uncharacterized membrane protein YuzA (DUF378 family)
LDAEWRHNSEMDERAVNGRSTLAVLLGVFSVGLVVIVLVDRIFGLGATVGAIAFSLLPLVAVMAALRHKKRLEAP